MEICKSWSSKAEKQVYLTCVLEILVTVDNHIIQGTRVPLSRVGPDERHVDANDNKTPHLFRAQKVFSNRVFGHRTSKINWTAPPKNTYYPFMCQH